jgi:hypothetical protein
MSAIDDQHTGLDIDLHNTLDNNASFNTTDAGGGEKEEKEEKEGGKKKKKKDGKKKDKNNIEPSADVVDYVSTTGQQYELLRLQPKGKYDVKLHMTNERTFFKYLFASFHLGAMGTFLLQYYSQPSFYKPVLIGFIWLTAFSFILFGLYTYYQRRQFLMVGRMKQLNGLQMHGPTYILVLFFIVFLAILVYSIDKLPSKTKVTLGGEVRNPSGFTANQVNTPTPFTTLLPSG